MVLTVLESSGVHPDGGQVLAKMHATSEPG
jgi:hypothetical protein